MMKRIFFISGIILGVLVAGHSQGSNPKDGARIEAFKIAYLTRKLNLSIDEAQRFWPLYNKYVDEIRQVKIRNRKLDEVSFEERVVNIRKKYKNEFTHALPEDRVNEFFKADKDFNNIVRKELHDREALQQFRKQNKRSLNP